MANPGTPTFDQLQLFLAVVEEGSFAGAARRSNRAVSAVSYGIANLEAQLGLTLFDREGTRKPQLTEAGQAMLADACAVSASVSALRARAKGMLEGLEAQVGLAVDVMLPSERLARILRRFADEYPTVTLRLHVEALGAISAAVLDGSASIGLSGPLSDDIPSLDTVAAGMVTMVPVAAPGHPLALLDPIPIGAARDQVQLVLTDRSKTTEGRDFSVISSRTWRLADLGAKHALLCEGIGWGNMPLEMIAPDLASGRLVRLALPDHTGGIYRLSGIWRSDTPPGPAGAWLMRQFVEAGRVDLPGPHAVPAA
ncbi:MAG: LysR family transcriptional regulator [Croceibacterium sp.]